MTASNPMEARIIAARLGAEGIVWELRGSVDGPLALGPIDVLVHADGFESAKELVLADDVASSVDIDAQEAYVTTGRDVLWAALALLALALFAVVRIAVQ